MKLTAKQLKMIAGLKKGEFVYIEKGQEFVYVEKTTSKAFKTVNIGKLLN